MISSAVQFDPSLPQPGVLARLSADTFHEGSLPPGMEKIADEDLGQFAEFFAKDTGYNRAAIGFEPTDWFFNEMGGPDGCVTRLQAFTVKRLAAEICLRRNPQGIRLMPPAERHLAGWTFLDEDRVAALEANRLQRLHKAAREEGWWAAGAQLLCLLFIVAVVLAGLWLVEHRHPTPEDLAPAHPATQTVPQSSPRI